VKKLIICLVIALLAAGSVFAQGIAEQPDNTNSETRGNRQERGARHERNTNHDRQNRQSENTFITVNGVLKLERGFVAVESGDVTYYVPGLNRFIGFINGLREGANVSVEGIRFEGRRFRNVVHPTKLTIEGRTYDFPRVQQNFNHRLDNSRQPQVNNRFGSNNAPNRRNNQNNRCCCCR